MGKIKSPCNLSDQTLFASQGDALMAAIAAIQMEMRYDPKGTYTVCPQEELLLVGTSENPEMYSIHYGYDDAGRWGFYYDAIP